VLANFGSDIRAWRETLGLMELARAARCSPSALCNVEGGRYTASPSLRARLLVALAMREAQPTHFCFPQVAPREAATKRGSRTYIRRARMDLFSSNSSLEISPFAKRSLRI
jgi:hypothetical protein